MRYASPRKTLHYPRGSRIDGFLEKRKKQDPNTSTWVHLEEVLEKLPKSIAEQDYEDFREYIEKTIKRHPDIDIENFYSIWRLISKRILKTPDLDGKEVFLSDSDFDELKKL